MLSNWYRGGKNKKIIRQHNGQIKTSFKDIYQFIVTFNLMEHPQGTLVPDITYIITAILYGLACGHMTITPK